MSRSAESKGQLEVRRWDEAYIKDAHFDQYRMIETIKDALDPAKKQPGKLTRLVANMEWALEDLPGVHDIVEYETRLNHVLPDYHDPVICTYDLSRFDASVVIDIMRTHPMVIVGGILQENPFYVPPDEMLKELKERAADIARDERAARRRPAQLVRRFVQRTRSMRTAGFGGRCAIWSRFRRCPPSGAGWVDDEIARSLGDVLLNTLSLDAVYLRVARPSGRGRSRFFAARRSSNSGRDDAVKASLGAAAGRESRRAAPTIADPSGSATLRVAVVRFGIGADTEPSLPALAGPISRPSTTDCCWVSELNQMAIVLQRRQAEEQVHDQREWLRVTLASIGDAVIATDIEGRVTFLNPVAEELTGWTQDDAQGKPLATVFRIFERGNRAARREPSRQGAARGPRRRPGQPHGPDRQGRHANGPIDDSAAPIRDRRGRHARHRAGVPQRRGSSGGRNSFATRGLR